MKDSKKIFWHTKAIRQNDNGFTLIEIIVCLAIFAALAGIIAPLWSQRVTVQREEETLDKLAMIKTAIVGDPQIVADGTRGSFGYLGDMGVLPSAIEDLYIKGTQPSFSFDSNLKIGAGWNGPYLDPEIIEYIGSLKEDAFGNDYDYTIIPFDNSTVGATVVTRIRSPGRDSILDTGDDLSLEVFGAETKSMLAAYIEDASGNKINGAGVTMNYPDDGSLTTLTVLTDINGLFIFNDIPYGIRSISVDAGLVYVPGSARTISFNNIEFSVSNFAASDVTITSITPVYTSSPQAYYKTLKLDGETLRDSEDPRAGSGDTVTDFGTKTIPGTGSLSDAIVTTIQSPVTEVGKISLGNITGGSTKLIEMKVFMDEETGSANPVNMSGVSFTVTFSDGSVINFTTS